MSHWTEIASSLASGLLTGGASAITTILAAFKDIRKRLTLLEERVGLPSDTLNESRGLFKTAEVLNKGMSSLRAQVEDWEREPPDWLSRAISRARNSSSVNLEIQQEFEDRVRTLIERLGRLETKVAEQRSEPRGESRSEGYVDMSRYVLLDDYEEDTRKRALEVAQIRESNASINGLLRGVMTAIGIIDGSKR